MEEIEAGFLESTGIEVKAVYGASGRLASQILNGAPFDVFVSADMEFPDSLHRKGFAAAAPRPYAYGKLVVWTSKPRPAPPGLSVLLDPAFAAIAVADPKRAPYGREAVKALRRAGLFEKLESRLVFGENVAQAGQYVMTGHADAALTAKSVVLAPEARGKGSWAEVDSALYDPIAQGAVVCRHGAVNHPEEAERFRAYLYSDPARLILSRSGYAVPGIPEAGRP
jgi:molybdate transport system substrate-binding protein